MDAIIVKAPGVLKLETVDPKPLKGFEAKIRVHRTSICGSDIKNVYHPMIIPQIIGHEFSGEVVQILHRSIHQIRLGDRVTAFPMIGCMNCHSCLKGIYRDCRQKRSLGFQLPGSFAEYINVDARFLIRLHEGISYEQGALVEHLACGFRLAKEMVDLGISVQSSILIIGDGPIALADIQFLRTFGYRRICLIGKHRGRKALAAKLGATQIHDCRNLPEEMELFDACIYAAKAEYTLERMSDFLSSTIVFFSQARIEDPILANRVMKTYRQGRAFAYMIEDFDTVMELIASGDITTDGLITHTVTLQDLKATEEIFSKKRHPIKTMILIPPGQL